MAEKQDIEFNKNEDQNKLKLSDLNKRLQKVYLGGGEKRIADHKAKGKIIPRECNEFWLMSLLKEASRLPNGPLRRSIFLMRLLGVLALTLLGLTTSAQGTDDYLISKYLDLDSARTQALMGRYFTTVKDHEVAYDRFGKPIQLTRSDTIEVYGVYRGDFENVSGEWGIFMSRWYRGKKENFSSRDYGHFLVPLNRLKDVDFFVAKNAKNAKVRRHERWLITTTKVCLVGIVCIGSIILITGRTRRCVRCKKWFSRKTTHTEDLGSFSYSYTAIARKMIRSWSGQHIGYADVPVERTRTVRRYRNTYCCKRCSHTWIGAIRTSRW